MSLYTNKYFKLQLSLCIALFLNVSCGLSQTNPAITSWLQNTTVTGKYYVSGNSTPLSNGILVNCQQVRYSSNYVYINTRGIPSYATGPFSDGNPSIASDQNAIFKFPLNPVKNNGTPTNTNTGNIGVFINGVALFDYRDGVAWNANTNALCGGPGNPPCPGGMGASQAWNRDAILAEMGGFDCSKAHPAMGNYHHHQNPSAFKFDLKLISTICNLYDADGLYTINSTKHSPLIGFAYDGFPIYGAYGYKNSDGSGGITRIKSSYQLRTTRGNGTVPSAATYPLGYFREDYEYIAHNEEDYLDEHNGRFCITPEYPNGMYCYFATVNEDHNSAYPYVVGPTFYGVVAASKVNSVTETVLTYSPPNASITISASSEAICSGNSVTFTATVVNGGIAPSFQWKKNNVNVGINSEVYIDNNLKNGDVVSCILTKDFTSTTSNNKSIEVKPNVVPEIFINTENTSICKGDHVTFNASTVNGGTLPIYHWKKNGLSVGLNSNIYKDSLISDNDIVTCIMISNESCLTVASDTATAIEMEVITCNPELQRNVIIIIADDLGSDWCGFQENHADTVKMPNVRKLISRGVRFSNAWSNPVCSPTRAGILTGRYSFRTGVGNAVINNATAQLNLNEITIPKLLKSENLPIKYSTANIGKWHLQTASPANYSNPSKMGYDYYAGSFTGQLSNYNNWAKVTDGQTSTSTTYATIANTNDAINWMSAQSNKPFFLWLAFNAPHSPFHLPPDSLHSYSNLSGTTADINQNPKSYYKAMAEAMDNRIGKLYNWLEQNNKLDNTDIIFIGDNGNPPRVAQTSINTKSKETVYQGGVHVPFIISGPSVLEQGRVSKALVNTQDLFATILELAGHSTWKEEINDNIIIDSKSLLPILKNSASEVRPWSYTEVFDISPNASVNSRAIRNNKYKLIYFDSLQTKEFYNLSIDLNENVNLLTDTLNEEECANFNYLCNEMSVLLGRNICDVLVSPTITITADKETICTGENVTFTSTITNTNANISYQWKKNGANVGSNSHVYSDSSLENNDVVTCILKENGLCLSSTISNSIKLNVSSKATPVITATASSDKICEGTEVMFNANILYGGTTPMYRWTRNGQHVGSNSPSYADQTLQNGDKISCELTSNATCITSEKVLSDNILIMVTSKVTPAIAISTSSTTINNGEKVVFSANTSNEGSSPVFQWIKNGSTIGENSSTYVDSNLVSGDIIYCKLLSNGFCLNSNEAVSNQIIITVITSGKEIEEIDIFQIFPIPVTDILLVQITDFARNNFEIKLYDISGRMIESKMLIQGSTLVSFDTQKLYSGEYIIHISDHTKTKSVIKKVIIQK